MPESDNAAYVPLLRGIGAEVVLPRGSLLQPENIYYLVDGYCALIALTKNGKEYSFIYFRPGMLLNFIPAIFRSDSFNLLTQRRFISIDPVIVTKTRCVLLSVRSDEFMRRLESDLELHRLLARALTENWINLFSLAIGINSLPAGARVCRLLFESSPAEAPHVVPRYLTYAEIAAHLSLHVITVTKIFRTLRQQGLLCKKGNRIILTDRERIARIGRGDEPLRYQERD